MSPPPSLAIDHTRLCHPQPPRLPTSLTRSEGALIGCEASRPSPLDTHVPMLNFLYSPKHIRNICLTLLHSDLDAPLCRCSFFKILIYYLFI